MSIYNDMANDAGYRYGTAENHQMAMALEIDHMNQVWAEQEYCDAMEQEYAEWCESEMRRQEILFRRFDNILGG